MKNPILYRRRIIPEECILLKDDRILFCDEDHIVTAWNTPPSQERPASRLVLLLSEGGL